MRFDILTLFPEYFSTPLGQSVIGRAAGLGLIDIRVHNIRGYAGDKHKTTDDHPYGGGPGMVMMVEPIVRAIESVAGGGDNGVVVLLSPQGDRMDQTTVREFACLDRLTIVCGRYEGVDERVGGFVDREISIGDYVLMGGEAPALVIIESVARYIPGVLGSEESVDCDSFSDGLLEYPQYTRPRDFRGHKVPDVLLSGNHKEIVQWRREESIRRTRNRRPDLIEERVSSEAF